MVILMVTELTLSQIFDLYLSDTLLEYTSDIFQAVLWFLFLGLIFWVVGYAIQIFIGWVKSVI